MSLHTENFDKMANEWWDEKGPMRALHSMNPVRLRFIRDAVDEYLSGELKALDVGCGAGLLTEPLSRMGFTTTGLDLSAPNIEIAKQRNAAQNLNIDYQCVDATRLIEQGKTFDIVCALEVIEHVEDQSAFVKMCADLTVSGGLVFFSTLNKTAKSYLFAILGAEYVLRMLPIGTHEHRLFVAPQTMEQFMREAGITPLKTIGMQYNPLFNSWKTSDDVSVNYIMVGRKA